jgi:UDP-3-O-acyl-N-acetylglucosamine deacetylase
MCVRAIEHLMSALYLHRVDNCVIEVIKGSEIPNRRGGSCLEYSEAIVSVGIAEQHLASEVCAVAASDDFTWEDSRASALPGGADLMLAVEISFPSPIGRQSVVWNSDLASSDHNFAKYTRARSFFRRDLSYTWPDGRNHWETVHDTFRGLPATAEDLTLLAFDRGTWLTEPEYDDEPAWHKLMDLVGDIGLLGARLAGRITVTRPGHAFNHRLLHWLAGTYRPDMPVTARLD